MHLENGTQRLVLSVVYLWRCTGAKRRKKGGHSDDIERPPRPHDAVCEVLPAEAEAMYQRIMQGRVAINDGGDVRDQST
jgi:hypothetical protein